MPTTFRVARVAAVMACVLLAVSAPCQEAAISAEMQARGRTLLQRLEDGAPVSVMVYGDSITDGWGTDGNLVYHRLFMDALRYRFPDSQIVSHVSGNPGWTTGDALRAWDDVMRGLAPDLMLVQFGGNNRGWGRPFRFFGRELATLLIRATTETNALVIACLPPWAEEIEDGAWAFAARDAAAEAGVPAAQFHRAIRESPHDFRGSFPFSTHPGSYTHVVMAREVLRAFDESTGAPAFLRCELTRGEAGPGDPGFQLGATISSTGGDAAQWQARLEFGRETREFTGIAAPDAPSTVSERFAVPEALPAGRSYSIPVVVRVRSGEAGSFDAGRLTVVPALTAGPEAEWHALSARSLVLGAHLWQGEADLSGRFRPSIADDALRIEVEVTDDEMTVADLYDPSRGDSVEVYLDLRPHGERGRPVYSEDVLALQIIPPAAPGDEAQWRNMDALPADLADIAVGARRTNAGYAATVDVPIAALQARRGEDWGGIGLDVGVNDADGGYRKTQMMWAGTGENYVNPAFLAGVYPGPLPDGATQMLLH